MFSKTEVCANVHGSVLDDEDDILAIVAHANAAEEPWKARDASDVKLFSKTMSAAEITFDCADNALVKNIHECIGDKPQGFSVSRRPYLRGNLGPNFVDGTKLNVFSENLNTTISNAREVGRLVDENADLAMRALISARAEKPEDTAKLRAMFSLINDEALRRASQTKPEYYARQLRAFGCDFKLLCQTWNTETGKAMFSVPVLHCQLFFAVSFPEALFAAFKESESKTRVICHGLNVYADLLRKNVDAMLADYKRAFVCVESIAMCKKDGEKIDELEEPDEPDEPEPKRARTASVPPPPCKAASAPQQRRGLNDSARSLTF